MRYIGIDPSTKTGIVILNECGEVLVEKEITSKFEVDPHRLMDITDKIIRIINLNCTELEVITIEGFSYGSKGRGVSTQYGIGWLMRSELIRKGFEYIEVSPGGLKKFATGKGNAAKDALVLPIYKKWNYEHKSDNVRDAYVLARMAMALDGNLELTAYQKEVIEKVKK